MNLSLVIFLYFSFGLIRIVITNRPDNLGEWLIILFSIDILVKFFNYLKKLINLLGDLIFKN